MAEHPPRDDRKKAREAKRNGGSLPGTPSDIEVAQSTVMEAALKKAEEARREKEEAEVSVESSVSESPKDMSAAQASEETFDVHSVASSISVEEQKRAEEMRELLAAGGVIPPESVRTPDIDISDVHMPQYGVPLNGRTQKDMDMLATGAESSIGNVSTETREDGLEYVRFTPSIEGTPKELKQKLRELVGKFDSSAKEKSTGGAESMKAYLAGRLGELDTALAAKTEKGFRSLGEWYGKLGWKSKVAVGLSLGIGMGVSAAAGASIPAALGLIFTGAGIGAQRIAGLSAMFLKYEKSTQDGKWAKEKAMGKAVLYTAGMTGAMMLLVEGVKEAIDFANQSQKDEAILKWIGSMTGSKTLAPEAAPAGPEISAAASPEATTSAMVEMPTVKASAGHGYEYMMKRLWEDLHTKGVELPANANPESDLARLLAADEDSIDKLVHEIASDSKHQFFRADGSSVLITPDAQMTIGARGELFLSDAGREFQVAPAHAVVTPAAFTAPHVESPAPTPEALDLYFGTQSTAPQEVNPLTGLVNEQTPAPVETATPQEINPSVPEPIISPEPIKTVDLTSAQGAATDQRVAEAAQAPIMEPHSVVNSFGVEVPTAVPHLYADGANRIFAYGGSPVERGKMILEYLVKNPDKIIYAADDNGEHRIPWHLVGGEAVPAGAPVQTSGFLGFFREFMKAPGPDEFEKVIK